MIPPDQVPNVSSDVIHRRMPDGTLLILKSGEFFRVDGVAVDLFSAVDGKKTAASICNKVAEKHGVEPAAFFDQAEPVFSSMKDLGVLSFD